MATLNLTATKAEETIIKNYLDNNVSDTLAEKIINGVRIEKDGKTLISKKTLETFMNYACEEARKLAEKGTNFACIKDTTVFNWAIHYFEENTIEGKLFNEDGTEYKPIKSKTESKPVAAIAAPPKPKPQVSIFDVLGTQTDVVREPVQETIKTSETQPVDQDEIIHKTEPSIHPALLRIFGDELKAEVD